MDNMKPTRRAMLKLASGAGVAILTMSTTAVTAVNQANAATSIDPKLTALIASYDRAAQEADTFEAQVHEPARVRSLAAVDAVPHFEHETGVKSILGNEIVWRTDDRGLIAMLKRIKADAPVYGDDLFREADTFLPQVEAREAELARARANSGVEQTLSRAQQLGDRCCEAIDAIAEYPVSTLTDLTVKIDFMRRIDSEYFDAVADDIFRLAGRKG